MENARLTRGNLVRDMAKLLESREFTDITLQVGSRQIPAHRAVLAARSPVFAAMLRHATQESASGCIDIPDVEEAVLVELLRYMYTDTTTEMGALTADLLVAADKYHLPMLKKICEQKMIRKIRVGNVAALAVLAVTYSCTRLRTHVVRFITARKDKVMCSDSWAEVQDSSPQAIAEICSMVEAAGTAKRTASEMDDMEDLEMSLVHMAQYGTLEEVQALVARGADLEGRSRKNWGRTALHVATVEGREEIVEFLLREGADVSSKDSTRLTPLHIAAERGHLEIVRALLRAGANINTKAHDGSTPLHVAAANGQVDIVRALLAASADVNARNRRWYTPLHRAAYWDHVEVAWVLLQAGADMGARNCWKKTPLEVVKQENQDKWKQILSDHREPEEIVSIFLQSPAFN